MSIAVLLYVDDDKVYPLVKIMNIFLETGVFSDALNISRTVSFFKKGDPEVLGPYQSRFYRGPAGF